jgi:hypothetical protein
MYRMMGNGMLLNDRNGVFVCGSGVRLGCVVRWSGLFGDGLFLSSRPIVSISMKDIVKR